MTAEMTKTATSVYADVGYIKNKIEALDLAKCDYAFIFLPSLKYYADESTAIKQYGEKGVSLDLVMDVAYWSTLEHSYVPSPLTSSSIRFAPDSPHIATGRYTTPT